MIFFLVTSPLDDKTVVITNALDREGAKRNARARGLPGSPDAYTVNPFTYEGCRVIIDLAHEARA